MWKILTTQIREDIHNSLINRGLFLEEQKGCHKRIRGTGDLLYSDQYIFKESKTKQKNVAMARIDSKKTYDIVPQSWIIDCLRMYKISDKFVKFLTKSMKNWKVDLIAGGKTFAEVKIQRSIFQGNALSPFDYLQ